jgi:hypothetical protein
MANNNNIYYNSAYIGALTGALEGSALGPQTAAALAEIRAACGAFATRVDSKIAYSGLVSNAAPGPEQLAPATPTIASNEQHRAALLRELCKSAMAARVPESATAADYDAVATDIVATWTAAIADLVVP